MAEFSVLGKRVPRVDALDKVTGKSIYTADISLPGMLWGKVLRSPYPHANIRRLDLSKALSLDGVKAVITVDDVPAQKGGKEIASGFPAFARERVFYAGQPIAAVAAVGQKIAEKALELIEVEYEILPMVMEAEEAMKPEAPTLHPARQARMIETAKADAATFPNNVSFSVKYGRGDVEAAFKQADIIIDNTFHTQRVSQGYLEPRSAVATVSADGKLTVWADNQGVFKARESLSAFLEIPVSKIKVMQVEVGGAFGAKISHTLSPICALLSLKSGMPVKMVTTRDEDFIANRPAPSSAIRIKLGADKEGRLLAADTMFVFDSGAYAGDLPMSMGASINALSPYQIPSLKVECYDVFTNKTPTGSFRAPNTIQAAFAMESQMDILARTLGIDPIDLRLKNASAGGDPMSNDVPFPPVGFKETLLAMKQYMAAKPKPAGQNQGRGIACGFWRGGTGGSAAHVNINADGTAVVAIGTTDLTGTRTTLAQMAAEELGIPFERVIAVSGDTETAPYADISAGSRTMHQMGAAVVNACKDAKEQLIQLAALQLKMKPAELEYFKGSVRVIVSPDKSISMAELAKSSLSAKGVGPVTGRGSIGAPPSAPMFSVHAADVEVDKATGKVRIISYVASQDVGIAINPTLVEGQMQGGVSQGIGWALTEEYLYKDGILQNPTLLDYRMPTALDLPSIETLMVETRSSQALLGMRGAGEPPLPPCLGAIANAIQDAVGIRLMQTPMTPEAVLKALNSNK